MCAHVSRIMGFRKAILFNALPHAPSSAAHPLHLLPPQPHARNHSDSIADRLSSLHKYLGDKLFTILRKTCITEQLC